MIHQVQQLWLDWPGHQVGLSFATLRFKDPSMERGFLAERKPGLVSQTYCLTWLAIVFGLAVIAKDTVGRGALSRDSHFSAEAYHDYLWHLACDIIMLGVGAALLVGLHCQDLVKSTPACTLERLEAFLMCLIICMQELTQPSTMSHLRGRNVADVYGPDFRASSSEMLILISGVVSVSHLGLPIRWNVLVSVETVGLLVYASRLFLVGGFEEDGGYHLALLLVLVGVSGLSKRSVELSERLGFADMRHERGLRCLAQLRLSQVAPVEGAEAPEAPRGSSSSSGPAEPRPCTEPPARSPSPAPRRRQQRRSMTRGSADAKAGVAPAARGRR